MDKVNTRRIVISALFVTAILLSALAMCAWAPVNRSHIRITDPADAEVEDDFDAILLTGDVEGDNFVCRLKVIGTVQPGYYYLGMVPGVVYHIGVLVKDSGSSEDEPYVYDLSYVEGREKNYDIVAQRDRDLLTMYFPLSFLRSDAYIVGMDAYIINENSTDSVSEGDRDSLEIKHLLSLGQAFGIVLAVLAVIAWVAVVVGFVRIVKSERRTSR